MGIMKAISDVIESFVAFVVLIIMAIISFFFTVFIVDMGASLANYSPSGDFVILSATLLVFAAIIAGALN